MSILNVPPTRTKQLELKADLSLATEGHDLLEQKREILVMDLLGLVAQIREVQARARERLTAAYEAYKSAVVECGEADIVCCALCTRGGEHDIRVTERTVAGVRLPVFELMRGQMETAPEESGDMLQGARAAFLRVLEVIPKLAELENAAWLLSREIKKTVRLVNALEHNFIPNYRETLRHITQVLENREIEEFSTMKLLKKRM